jgi:hypothetical protein
MSESEWLSGADPLAMLKHLRDGLVFAQTAARSDPFPRVALLRLQPAVREKLLGFALECCRRIDDLIPDAASRQALGVAGEMARQFPGERGKRDAAARAARAAVDHINRQAGDLAGALAPIASPAWAAWQLVAADWVSYDEAYRAAEDISRACQEGRYARTTGRGQDPRGAREAEAVAQAVILRDLFGPSGSSCQAPSIDLPQPRWFDFLIPSRRAASAARQLARDIAARLTFEDMPRLGELLRAAGCNEANALSHCASPAGHVRGCWVLSAILGSPAG